VFGFWGNFVWHFRKLLRAVWQDQGQVEQSTPAKENLMSLINKFLQDDEGATAIEYGLIAALVSVAIIGVLGTLGDNLTTTFTTVSDGLGVAAEEAADDSDS